MLIQINGTEREVPQALMLEALLRWLDLPLDRIAVERNRSVVPRARWSATPVEADDRIEIVQLVGGGCGKPKA